MENLDAGFREELNEDEIIGDNNGRFGVERRGGIFFFFNWFLICSGSVVMEGWGPWSSRWRTGGFVVVYNLVVYEFLKALSPIPEPDRVDVHDASIQKVYYCFCWIDLLKIGQRLSKVGSKRRVAVNIGVNQQQEQVMFSSHVFFKVIFHKKF